MSHYIRIYFVNDIGVLQDGSYTNELESTEAKICEEGDFETSKEEEATLSIIGKAFCKPES